MLRAFARADVRCPPSLSDVTAATRPSRIASTEDAQYLGRREYHGWKSCTRATPQPEGDDVDLQGPAVQPRSPPATRGSPRVAARAQPRHARARQLLPDTRHVRGEPVAHLAEHGLEPPGFQARAVRLDEPEPEAHEGVDNVVRRPLRVSRGRAEGNFPAYEPQLYQPLHRSGERGGMLLRC